MRHAASAAAAAPIRSLIALIIGHSSCVVVQIGRHDSIGRVAQLPRDADYSPRPRDVTSHAVLSIRSISKSYGGVRPRQVLRDVSLDIAQGELVAIVGESG